MAKIAITMPYFNRQFQLIKTLHTIAQSDHKDVVVIIADDNSPISPQIPDVPFDVDMFRVGERKWINCGPVHNMAFQRALTHKPDIIMIQSPECYHVGDVLSHANETVTDGNYLAYACFQVDKPTTFKDHDIMKLSDTSTIVTSNPNGMGQNGWWNHSFLFWHPQYWCAAITANNLRRINGIDERFAQGYAIEDGWFVDQVERSGLKIEVVDYPFVVHQWHERIYPKNTMQLVEKNKALWERLRLTDEWRSVHTITPDL